MTYHTIPACIESLAELPVPDVVLISQEKTDHCHKETLLQLDPNCGATILGTPAAVKKIKGWKHFNPTTLHSLRPYDEQKEETVHRIALPPISSSGSLGEVTIANLSSRADLTGLHNAIGITYRAPSTTCEETISVLYSPHGVSYSIIESYASAHLQPLSALPLTALLHSFDRASNPWYLGGNICAGTPGGSEIARNLSVKHWISAHDERKADSGMAVKAIKFQRFERDEIEKECSEATQLISLDPGQECVISAR